MQQQQLPAGAAPAAPSWYLSRGDKRYGPLGNRELMLLAERGELKPDDLLWRQGFSSWKQAREIGDLLGPDAPSPAAKDRAGAAANGAAASAAPAEPKRAARQEPA